VAGRKDVFQKALSKAHNYAWEGQWEKAIEEYKKALAEFPDEPVVWTSLGLACAQSGRLTEALEAYIKASQLWSGDPIAMSRVAQIQEKLGQKEEAANTWMAVGELYWRQKARDKAIEAWERASQVAPDQVAVHERLAQIYAQGMEGHLAAREHLALARIYQRQGRKEEALQECQKALELDKDNREALSLMEALHYGRATEEQPLPSVEEKGSPVELTKQKALTELAGVLFEEGQAISPGEGQMAPLLNRAQIDALITQALDFQTRGKVEEAIASYKTLLEAGVNQPAIHFNLGLLLRERLRFDEAISHLQVAVKDPDYALGSHFALGECYRAQGQIDQALEHFIEVLKIVDLRTVRREQADDLIQLYERLADSYVAKGDREKALHFANSLVEFLSSKGWEDKVMEARQRLNELVEEGFTTSLAELIEAPHSDALLSSMALIQEYVRRGMLAVAMEECYRGLAHAPYYLPLHLRLAEILVKQDRIEEAVAKYMAVADTYNIRGAPRQAIRVYRRILKIAPMDVTARAKFIDLLLSYGEVDQALEQYLALADVYYQLAQVDKALEKYKEALHLTPRASEEREWRVKLLHKIGDIYMQRLEWREALGVYRQIKRFSPEDERARLHLAELYYKLGQVKKALAELDELVQSYESQGEMDKALSILEDMVRLRPQEIPLRSRLAQAYLRRGMREKAIAELDALGELQLDAGLREEARHTIEQLMALSPENAPVYKRLLDQLTS